MNVLPTIQEKKHRELRSKKVEENSKTIKESRQVRKNIFRMFKKWVEQRISSELELSKFLDAFLSANEHNCTSLMTELSKNQDLRKAFLAFSESDAHETLGESGILDKQGHLDILKWYRNICEQAERGSSGSSDSNEREEKTLREAELRRSRHQAQRVRREQEKQGLSTE